MTTLFSESEAQEMFKDVNVASSTPNCLYCGLYKKVHSPKMKVTGEGKKKCLVIGEAPGKDEDQNWKQLGYDEPTQFIGDSGQYLREKIEPYELDLDRDFWKINAINCRTPDNREPTKSEIEYCRPMIDNAIKELKPQFIWLLGRSAIESFYNKEFKKNAVARWRSLCIPDRDTNAYIIPIYHPSYPMRDPNDLNLQAQFERDIKHAVSCLSKKPFKYEDEKRFIKRLYKFEDVVKLLEGILHNKPTHLAFDYEATGLKPYRPGHKIVSISLCTSIYTAWSFPYEYGDHFTLSQRRKIKSLFRKILTDINILKIAHNMKFEEIWSRKMLGVKVVPWKWCTMTAAHVIDNRRKFCGLKFQTYLNFGRKPYNKHVEKYLKGEPFNRIEECDLKDLLLYGGLDSIYCMMLFKKQIKYVTSNGNLIQAYQFFHDGTLEMGEIQYNGIHVDEEYCHKESKRLENRRGKIIKRLNKGVEAKKFREHTGYSLNLTSNKDLGVLFYEVLKMNKRKTEKGNYIVDENTISKFNLPFGNALIRSRKLEKIKGTYLASFMRETYDGVMHPNFDLIVPVSFRGSGSSPNFQNIPVRNKEAQRSCRRAIRPSKGNKLLSGDYSGAEVGTAAWVTKDKALIKYVTDKSTDMHRDCAMDIWLLPKEEITEPIRFYAKNDWTFAEFYGDYYKQIAGILWEDCLALKITSGITLKEHMREQGIRTLDQFTEHLQGVEHIFWNERFVQYRDWKNEINEKYRKDGYIETDLGFRFQGYMTKNQVCNYPIQGPSFHMLLWMLTDLGKTMRKCKWRTKTIGQIHDDGVYDLHPEEESHVINTITEIGTKMIKKHMPWINVPLKIKFKISEINGNWYEMENVK